MFKVSRLAQPRKTFLTEVVHVLRPVMTLAGTFPGNEEELARTWKVGRCVSVHLHQGGGVGACSACPLACLPACCSLERSWELLARKEAVEMENKPLCHSILKMSGPQGGPS